MLSTLIKRRKKNHYNPFFKNNLNDLKHTWRRTRKLISTTNPANFVSATLIQNEESTIDPKNIGNFYSNFFGNFFSTIAKETKSKINFLKKPFFNFLETKNSDNFFFKHNQIN